MNDIFQIKFVAHFEKIAFGRVFTVCFLRPKKRETTARNKSEIYKFQSTYRGKLNSKYFPKKKGIVKLELY